MTKVVSMGELMAFIRRELEANGVDGGLAERIKNSVEHNFRGERLYIGKAAPAKRAILEFGSSVPATYIARKLGVTVRHVRKMRQMAGGR